MPTDVVRFSDDAVFQNTLQRIDVVLHVNPVSNVVAVTVKQESGLPERPTILLWGLTFQDVDRVQSCWNSALQSLEF